MSDRTALFGLLDAIAEQRILVVGDLMLDRFVTGAVERISPEAPIPVLHVERENVMLGGAGNVVRNLQAIGARSRMVAVIGNDDPGEEVRRLLTAGERSAYGIIADPSRRTTIKTRFVAGAQQIMRADRETVSPLARGPRGAVVESARMLLADSAVLVLSDYGKGVLAGGLAEELISASRDAGKTVVVDPKGRDYGRYAGADVITPNRTELGDASGAPTNTAKEVAKAARSLIMRHRFGAVIATLGKDGMIVVEAKGAISHLAAEAREVFDVSGAGDTVVAAIAASLAGGATVPQAATLANVAAGIAVGKVGTAVADAAEIANELRHRDLSDAEAKVRPLNRAREQIERWRRQSLRIGFTNGCFDLLHPGHVSLLAQAKAACDRLVVGLNSDASTKRLKGPQRPVQNEAARSAVLASLTSVDLVVIFGEDTPLHMIETLQPDVLVKGADYKHDEVVGADLVESYGGSVLLAHLEPGHSTTATIARIAE